MSILGAESYAAVCHLVTDVEVLSREERNHVLWYACDGGDLSMVKSVIRAGCDVDHFHRGHTPLMMASIGGHDDVVKELILAGCKVDLQSSKCFVGWFTFIANMASAWPTILVWAVTAIFMIVTNSVWVQVVCYWLHVLTIALQFLSEDFFKVSRVLRIKARIRYIAWVGIVPAAALVWRVVGTAASEAQFTLPATVLVLMVTVTVLVAVTGSRVATVVTGVARTGSGIVAAVVAVAVAVTRMLAGGGAGAIIVAGAVGVVLALTVADAVTAVAAVGVAVIGMWIGVKSGADEEIIPYVFVGPGVVGMVMAVTILLALVLTVAIADAGAVPLAVVMIVTWAVVAAGIGGVAIRDTILKSADVPMASMLPVFVLLALTPIGALRRMSTTSISGMTALHYAAWYDHITCGTHLVDAGANVHAENKYFRTPLHICSRRFRAAVQRVQSHPPKQVIAVIGNAECGKSTLIAALQSESRTLFQSLVYKLAQVYDITRRTAGIETVPYSSNHREVLFYDFAGHSDYYGPHQPFLEAMLGKSVVTVSVILLVKVTERQDAITQQLVRWLQPVALASIPSTPHVIVVGSFLDQAKLKN